MVAQEVAASPSMSESQNEVEIRRASVADVAGVVECSAALFAEDAGVRDPNMNADWPREHGADRFRQMLDDPDRLLLVADRAGEIVGYLTAMLEQPSDMQPVRGATLVAMYVRPDLRGRHAGGRLTEAFVAWAKDRGARRAEVTTYQSNAGARRFYERNGFVPLSVTLERLL